MGRPCVSGASEIFIDEKNKIMKINNNTYKYKDTITINGSTGEVIEGAVETVQPKLSENFNTIMKWSEELKKLNIRTNAETPDDVLIAKKFGAEGIGLCRTEHMFFDANRILFMREMILSKSISERKKALAKLEPFQKEDFKKIFTIMHGLPVTIRLLDPPLHEFLPKIDEDNTQLLELTGLSSSDLESRIEQLEELNPMLGHRGSRLAITFPEIYEMQCKAIFEAASEVYKKTSIPPKVEIMIPLIFSKQELDIIKKSIIDLANQIKKTDKNFVDFLIGTMIELPRAALVADKIAVSADFFSFGTNDLTQTTYGISRDDSGRFLDSYIEKQILDTDPFVSIDESGVGKLIEIATSSAKKTNPEIKLGICGEHGGDPKSVLFCHKQKLDYVSCSPFRIPIAKLAAAQAAINET
tara:strand:- start:572 stop:1810 length:1239 start_codon:yes stop_codon:yes gene_type:complete